MALWGLALTYTTRLFRVETLGHGQGRTGRATLHQCPHTPFLTLSQRAHNERDRLDSFDAVATGLLLTRGRSVHSQPLPNLCGGRGKRGGALRYLVTV